MKEDLLRKEDTESSLREELSHLTNQLLATQHQLASIESKDSTGAVLLEKQLQSEKRINEELQGHLNEAIKSMEKNSEVFSKQEHLLNQQIVKLKSSLESKESVIKDVCAEKERIDEQRQELKQQVETLTNQVKTLHEGLKASNDKVQKLCLLVDEKEERIEILTNEQTTHSSNTTQLQVC